MKEIVIPKTPNAKAIGPYNLAVKANGFMFTSGMLGLNPETGELREGVVAQADQALTNLKNLLADEGLTFKNVVKSAVFVQSLGDFAAINEVYARYFNEDCPSRSCVEVAALPKGALVEIELIVAL